MISCVTCNITISLDTVIWEYLSSRFFFFSRMTQKTEGIMRVPKGPVTVQGIESQESRTVTAPPGAGQLERPSPRHWPPPCEWTKVGQDVHPLGRVHG